MNNSQLQKRVGQLTNSLILNINQIFQDREAFGLRRALAAFRSNKAWLSRQKSAFNTAKIFSALHAKETRLGTRAS
jgi:hypothetical protein